MTELENITERSALLDSGHTLLIRWCNLERYKHFR